VVHDVAILVRQKLLVQVVEECAADAIVQARLEHRWEVNERQGYALLGEELRLWWVHLHLIEGSRNDTVEADELEALPLHLFHATAEVKDEIVAQPVSDLHASLAGVTLGRRENNVHWLVREMVLQKLLILEAVRRARDHRHSNSLDKHLHGHNGVRITSIQHENGLNAIFVEQATQLMEQ
jgi:hypothetical protein